MRYDSIRRTAQETAENDITELGIKIMEIKQDNLIEENQAERKYYTEEEDYLEKTIGTFGLWQGIISVTVTLTRAISMWNLMSIVFLTPVTEFSCVEFSNNVPIEVKNSSCYDNCLRYNYSSVVGKTIIEEFNLICQDAWLASFVQFILMLGVLPGVWIFGWMSDRFGRRTALLLSTLMNAVFMVTLSFSPNIIVLCCIRFMIGVATGGSLIVGVVHVMEIIGKKYREIAGVCCVLPDCIAEASLAAFSYFTTSWQGYTLSYGVATCVIFVLMMFVPESPRWLVSNGKVDEAIKVITSGAKRNHLDTSNIKADIIKAVEDMNLQHQDTVKTTYFDFFKNKRMFILTLTVCIIWFGLCMCFYGIYQYVTIISMNMYITVIILGLIQVVLAPLEIIVNKKFGRKKCIIGTMCAVGTTMIVLIFVPEGHWLGTLLGVIGFANISTAFGTAYIHVSELFPTPLRNKGYGVSSSGARAGAMIAPFVANLTPRWLPSMFFGIVPFITSLCCLLLPETKGQNLKDTIEK